MNIDIKFSEGQRVKVVALITRYVDKTGIIRSVLSDSTPIPRYLVKLDDLHEEILFDQWELVSMESTTQE